MNWTSRRRTAAKLQGLEKHGDGEKIQDGQKMVNIPKMTSSKRAISMETLESSVMRTVTLEGLPDTANLLALIKSI